MYDGARKRRNDKNRFGERAHILSFLYIATVMDPELWGKQMVSYKSILFVGHCNYQGAIIIIPSRLEICSQNTKILKNYVKGYYRL